VTPRRRAERDPNPGTVMTPSDPPPDRQADQRLAVALRYDGKADPAPKVAATGRGLVAERILALARQLKGLSRGTQATQAYGRQPSKS